MKVIAISTDRKVFEPGSVVRERMIEYGKIFEKMEIIIFSNRGKNYESRIKLSENVFAYPTNSRNKLFYIFDAFKVAKSIIHNSKFNIHELVLSAQDPFETGLVGLILKFKYHLPLQLQVHTDFANRYFIFHSPLNVIRFVLAELTLGFADAVRVVSERIKRSVHNLPEHIAVLPIFVPQTLTEPKKNKDKITFLTVARLEKEKNLETAIKAFAYACLDAELVIVGDGSQRENLEHLARELKIENKVIFAGWQNNLQKFYAEADIYISTSLYEGYGMATVEAAAAGLPLIVSDAGLTREIFFDGREALIFKQKDFRVLSEKMKKLSMDLELRRKIGLAARAAAEKNASTKEEYLKRYREAMQLALDSSKQNSGLFKKNILLRYLVSGLLAGALTNLGLLFILTHFFGIFYIYSSIIAFLASITLSFGLQKFWTFSDKELKGVHSQFSRYTILALLGLVINALLMYILVDRAHLWYILAQIIVNAFIAVLNFLMYKFFIFHKK